MDKKEYQKNEKIHIHSSERESSKNSGSESPETYAKKYSTKLTRKKQSHDAAEVSCSFQKNSPTSESMRTCKVETTGIHETVVRGCDWKQVMTTTVNSGNEILLELDTYGNEGDQPQNIPMIELVVAVQSAIKHRQGIIDEWKKRAEDLAFQLQDLTNEKNCFENQCREKEHKIELLQKKLKELNCQFGDLSSQTDNIHDGLSSYRVECDRLKSVYQCAMHELSEARSKLSECEDSKLRLEHRLRLQEESNQKLEQQLRGIEPELFTSRESLRQLQDRINSSESELTRLRQMAQLESNKIGCCNDYVSASSYQQLLDKLKDSMKLFEEEKKKGCSIQEEMSKFSQLVDSLTKEKDDLCNFLSELESEKKQMLSRNQQLESQLVQTQNQVSNLTFLTSEMQHDAKCLSEKLDQVLQFNKDLEKELDQSQQQVKCLSKNLQTSTNEKSNLTTSLNTLTCELDRQKSILADNEALLRGLKHEKRAIETKMKSQEELERKRLSELNRMTSENEIYRNENLELLTKCDKIANSLYISEEEVRRLRTEVTRLTVCMEETKRSFQSRVELLQNHNLGKEEDWKSYICEEMTRLNEQHQKELEKYYSEMLANRVSERERSPLDSVMQMELSAANKSLEAEVAMLRKELDQSSHQLQQTLLAAEEERQELLTRASDDQSRLLEQLNTTKANAVKISVEIESQIKRLTQKISDDSVAITKLTGENKRMQCMLDRTQVADQEWEQTRAELISERESLRGDLAHCRNLLCITENTCDRLKTEMADVKKTIEEYSEMKDSLHREVVNLQKILGQKESQLEINMATLIQTRNQLGYFKEDNNRMHCELTSQQLHTDSLEEKIRGLTCQIHSLNESLTESNREKKELCDRSDCLSHEINALKSTICTLTQETSVVYERCQYTEKCLSDLQLAHAELKKKLHQTESALVQSQGECKDATNRYLREMDVVQSTENQLTQLQNDHAQLQQSTRIKISHLEGSLRVLRDEIEQNRLTLHQTEIRLQCVRNCLSVTESAYTQSALALSDLWETVWSVVKSNGSTPNEMCSEGVSQFFNEVVVPGSDFLRPIIVDHDTCASNIGKDDLCVRHGDLEKFFQSNVEQKLIKLKSLLRDILEKKSNAERNEITSNQELNILRETMWTLKKDYEDQLELLAKHLSERTKNLELAECQLIETKMLLISKEEYLKNISAASMNSLQKIESLEEIIIRLQTEKNHFQNEMELLSQKLSDLERINFSLSSQLRDSECRLSKIQIRNVSLEGDIENLKLTLQSVMFQQNDSSEALIRESYQRKDLLDQIAILQADLECSSQMIADLKADYSYQQKLLRSSENISREFCDGKGNCSSSSRCNHLHACLADFELERQLLAERLEASQNAEHEARLMVVGLEESLKSLRNQMQINEIEKASLEGRVCQLQKVLITTQDQDQFDSQTMGSNSSFVSGSSTTSYNSQNKPSQEICSGFSALFSSQRLEQERIFLRDNTNKLQASISVLENEKESLQGVVSRLKLENDNLNQSLCRAREQKLSVEKELESFRHKTSDLQRMVMQREQEVDHLRKSICALKNQLKENSMSQSLSSSSRSITPMQFEMADASSTGNQQQQSERMYPQSSSNQTGGRISAGVISCSSRISCHKDTNLVDKSQSCRNQSTSSPNSDRYFDEFYKSTYVTSIVQPNKDCSGIIGEIRKHNHDEDKSFQDSQSQQAFSRVSSKHSLCSSLNRPKYQKFEESKNDVQSAINQISRSIFSDRQESNELNEKNKFSTSNTISEDQFKECTHNSREQDSSQREAQMHKKNLIEKIFSEKKDKANLTRSPSCNSTSSSSSISSSISSSSSKSFSSSSSISSKSSKSHSQKSTDGGSSSFSSSSRSSNSKMSVSSDASNSADGVTYARDYLSNRSSQSPVSTRSGSSKDRHVDFAENAICSQITSDNEKFIKSESDSLTGSQKQEILILGHCIQADSSDEYSLSLALSAKANSSSATRNNESSSSTSRYYPEKEYSQFQMSASKESISSVPSHQVLSSKIFSTEETSSVCEAVSVEGGSEHSISSNNSYRAHSPNWTTFNSATIGCADKSRISLDSDKNLHLSISSMSSTDSYSTESNSSGNSKSSESSSVSSRKSSLIKTSGDSKEHHSELSATLKEKTAKSYDSSMNTLDAHHTRSTSSISQTNEEAPVRSSSHMTISQGRHSGSSSMKSKSSTETSPLSSHSSSPHQSSSSDRSGSAQSTHYSTLV